MYRIHNLIFAILGYIHHVMVVTKNNEKFNKSQILHAFKNCPYILDKFCLRSNKGFTLKTTGAIEYKNISLIIKNEIK